MAKANKRGVSEVVATVLIVLVTVLAGAIIANFVIPFVKDNLNQGSECVPYRDYFKFEEKIDDKRFNCYKQEGEYLNSVKNNGGSNADAEKVLGFQIVLGGDAGIGGTSVIKVPVSGNSPPVFMYDTTQVSQLSLPGKGEVYTYKFTSTDGYRNAKIYPILKSGKICEASDEINLAACSGV